jgi:polyphosphate kinase
MDTQPAEQPLAPTDISQETAVPIAKVPPIPQLTRNVPLFNRELSWLEFDRRVLAEAENPDVPLLERVKFLSIAASNLDEFFMVRASGIRDLVLAGVTERSADGLTPEQQLRGLRERSNLLIRDMYACASALLPELKKAGIRIDKLGAFSKSEQDFFRDYFDRSVAPILTPLAIDPGHPFPFLPNLTLNLAVTVETQRGDEHVAFIRIPTLVPRFIALPGTTRYLPVEQLVAGHATRFFPGLTVKSIVPFRVVRNADISIREDEVQDLLQSVESELRRRDRKEVVWMIIGSNAEPSLMNLLTTSTGITLDDVVSAPGLMKLADLMQIYGDVDKPSLREAPFNPRIASELASSEDIFSIIRRGDILLHRPYDSFSSVVELVQSASEDPDVVAIKQTLYRTDEGSPIVEALISAATRGKQVTAVVELQARFDEMKNIAWARRLENAGVQVVYGLVGIKTHCKILLVVRREGDELRRYVHLSTGNYNARTARLYTDIDLFTCDPGFGDDAAQLMNFLTGFSIATAQEIFEHNVPELRWKHFIVAPIDYHHWVLSRIENEIRLAGEGKPTGIAAKLNSLVDPTVIEALYRASQAGVRVDLVVRGICCLVPGVPGLSDNIKVLSVIDRFLEHSRVILFRNGGQDDVYIASGDWMPRNFFRRIEVAYPILSPELKRRLIDEVLAISLADTIKGWRLQSDGTYKRRKSADRAIRSQEKFIEITRSQAVRIGPYEEILRRPGSFRRKAKKNRKKEKNK